MKKMLFISAELPFPLQSGGKVKTWNMLNALSRHWQVTLVCPLKGEDEQHLQAFCDSMTLKQVITARVDRPETASSLIKSYLHGLPLNVWRTESDELCRQVQQQAQDQDIVLLDHYETLNLLPSDMLLAKPTENRPLLIYHAHNIYHQIWKSVIGSTLNPFYKLVCFFEYLRVRRYEGEVCKIADMVYASPNDLEEMSRCGFQVERGYETLHLGEEPRPNLPDLLPSSTDRKLCFLGLLSWEPNVNGLLWFLRHVWPRVIGVYPGARLHIAGKNPDPRLIAMVDRSTGVTLQGFVDDLETLYAGTRIAIAPLLFGGGMNVKVVTTLARGLPTLTTTVGAEGLEVNHGEHIMIADTPDDQVRAIFQLFEQDELWQRLSFASMQIVKRKYSWDALFSAMVEQIETLERSGSQ